LSFLQTVYNGAETRETRAQESAMPRAAEKRPDQPVRAKPSAEFDWEDPLDLESEFTED